jgi:hypothetical protein
MTKLCDLD